MTMKRHLLWVIGVLALGAPATPVLAVDAPPRPPPGALGLIRDLRLTVLARRALQTDRDLTTLNLGVRVREGVAEIWGPIPDVKAARQAVVCLETIPGIVRVQTDFFEKTPDRTLDLELFGPPAPPTLVEAAKPDGDTGRMRAAPAALPLIAASRPPRPAAVAEQPPIALLPPRTLPRREPMAPQGDLQQAVERIRNGQARFRAIDVRVQGGTILVSRGATTGDDAVELAQELRVLPGVVEVRLVEE
jgi:hypothetical protein